MIACRREHLEQRCAERGYDFASVRGCIVSQDGDLLVVDETHADYPRARKGQVIASGSASGAGAELKAVLKDWLGIEPTAGCSCNSMAARMDALGPDWCESDAGMAEILDVMRSEHARRWEAGQTRLPWTDFGAKQLVRLACRRARKRAAS